MKWVDTAQPAMAQHRRRGGYRPAFVVTKTVTSCDLGIAQQQLIYIYYATDRVHPRMSECVELLRN